MALFAWDTRNLHCYSVYLAASENSHLVRNLVRVVFGFLAPNNKTGRKRPIFIDLSGGADGTRTRDLRRDRPGVYLARSTAYWHAARAAPIGPAWPTQMNAPQ